MKLSLEYIHGHVIQGGGHLSLLLINGKESHHLPGHVTMGIWKLMLDSG